MKSKSYELLVFDWDGTLMDSRMEIVTCFQSAARDLNLRHPTLEDISNVIGIGMKEAVSELFPELTTDVAVAELVERYRYYYFHPEKVPSELFTGVHDMLLALEKSGYLLAVATSKGRRGLDVALDRSGLREVFHFTRCIDEALSKPHPQMLLDILDFTGIDADKALMIGDTEYDLQMARNARVHGVGVCCGAHARERLLACEPVACLNETRELHNWLNG